MADGYRVNASFEMPGAFWPPDASDQVFTGTLTARKGRVTLTSAPIYKTGCDPNEMVGSFANAVNNRQPPPTIPSLLGYSKSGDCTLLSVLPIGSDRGRSELATGRSLVTGDYRAMTTIMGLHVESRDAPTIESAAFYFTKVDRYVPASWSSNTQAEVTVYAAPHRGQDIFRFSSVPLRCEVFCEVFALGRHVLRKSVFLRSVPRIRIVPEKPQSLDWFSDLAFRAENLFTLVMGTSVELKQFDLFRGDQQANVIYRTRRRREKIDLQAWIRCSDTTLTRAFANWLAVPRDHRPVELTVLGMMRKSNLYLETEFLSLAQALEGFSRIQGGKPKPFARRIGEIYDQLTPDFARSIVGERAEFVARVKATRNYFTHLGLPQTNDVVRDSTPLFLLNRRLHAFLRCVMLFQLGFPEDDLKEPIQYQATKWL